MRETSVEVYQLQVSKASISSVERSVLCASAALDTKLDTLDFLCFDYRSEFFI